ncbi:hypothetical protein 4L372X_002 [Aeromonas phage 4_L372X]|nr:hypothetical protein 4L372X_002 [Aeromonas phage 4_L372X]
MKNQYTYIHKSALENLTASSAIFLGQIAYWHGKKGFCSTRVTNDDKQVSLAEVACISDSQAAACIKNLVSDGWIEASRTRYSVGGINRLGYYRLSLADKAKRLWLNSDGSRKALGDDFIKVSNTAIKTIGVNAAVALAKVINLFLNRAASKGRKGLSIKSLNLASSIIGLPLSTLRRYLSNELASLVRWNASECVLSLAGGADAVKEFAGADVVTSHAEKSIAGVMARFAEFADWIDSGSMDWERFESWAESIIVKLGADGVPTGDVESELEAMAEIYQ